MTDRETLIARKQEVLRRLTRARREMAGAERAGHRARCRELSSEIEQLMAEEYRLRIAIDRARP